MSRGSVGGWSGVRVGLGVRLRVGRGVGEGVRVGGAALVGVGVEVGGGAVVSEVGGGAVAVTGGVATTGWSRVRTSVAPNATTPTVAATARSAP
jgi:hypothetical protein